MTAGTGYGRTKQRELLYETGFPLKLKVPVYKSYVKPAILYICKALCLSDD